MRKIFLILIHFLKIFRKPTGILCLVGMIQLGISNPGQAQLWNPNHAIGTITGNYKFSYNQAPDQLVELRTPGFSFSGGFTYQWESSPTPMENNFTPVSANGNGSSYTIPVPFTKTTYYRRKTYGSPTNYIYSNIIKISLVSINWEDINYVRDHEVNTTGITDWQTVDQLPIGQKLQTTTYLDGLGRSVEKISRETATPASGNSLWGDMINFSQFDGLGREPLKYMPYTTTTESGRFKTAPLNEQSQYYASVYNETSAFSTTTFDNSPIKRVLNIKDPGGSWASGPGTSATYDVNSAADSVQIFSVDYVQGNPPVNRGAYPANTLYKLTYTDENNKQVVEYTDLEGKLVLKKIQLDDAPSSGHAGWICTYSVYDNYYLLRFQLQPEAVKYLDANGWSFAGTSGQQVLNELCFQYNYDDKGRMIWKKAPGAAPINTLYDIRDRTVFTQNGNQAALPTPQWTANLYDELDRPTITALYNTTETIANLQNDINNAVTYVPVYINNPGPALNDPVLDNRQTTVTRYAARNSISFVSDVGGSFQTVMGDHFLAEIDPAATTTGSTVLYNIPVLQDPISSNVLNNPAITTILKYEFYDNYDFGPVKAFDNNFTNATAYGSSDPNVQPILKSSRTAGLPTGSLTRVLGTSTFLAATLYYDEKGRLIQTLSDNIKTGTDITTQQYHFDGRLLSSCSSHSAPGTGYAGFITLTKFLFDKLGRVISLQKQFGSNPFKTIASYDYDDMGRLKAHHLDPGYNNLNSGGSGLETLQYSFNLHNQLTGINKDYALKTAASYNKWAHFFGLYIGYDNKDNTFSHALLNGQVTGLLWNSQGDDAQRKYDYSYDNAGRLTNATYKEQQHPGDGWNNSQMDFSVSGTSGQITYDLNGNLLTMQQKGVLPGSATPITIDDLRYTYASYSNKLLSVTDQMTTPNSNGLFGDFKDGGNAAGTPDYVYDANGNLVVDLNKNVQSLNNGATGANGISYNYLDKPEQIRITGKGTIQIVYSAEGEKLKRIYTPENGGTTTTTTYIDEFVYQSTGNNPDSLAYINFEEGRIRVMQPISLDDGKDALAENGNLTLPNAKTGAYDYFILDYQKNLRMILTEETHIARNTCTMETGRASAEDPVFGQTGAANEVEATRYPTPAGWQSVNASASVSRLGNLAGLNVGPNTLQKVMAGDQITASVQYYYQSVAGSSNPNIIPNVLNSLAGALTGGAAPTALVKNNVAAITGQLNNAPGFIAAVEPSNSTTGPPQAYLTILFFDERFNFIAAADGGVAQQQVDPTWSGSTPPLGLVNVKAPKNGYVFVYVSNRSDQDVYFDNLAVGITAGNIIEENHYYAFGLRIAAISSHKLGGAGEGTLKNAFLYNDKELFDEADLNWLDYGFRNYDPQIGRFVEMDPLTDGYAVISPYLYAFNDPIGNVDVAGLFGGGIGATAETAKTLTEAVCVGYRTTKTALDLSKLAMSFTRITIQGALVASDVINNSIGTQQVGGKDLEPGQWYKAPDGKIWKMTMWGDLVEAFMPKTMTVSKELFELVKKEEHLGKKSDNIYDEQGKCIITCPYDDPVHYATIGYGHLIDYKRYDRSIPAHRKWDNGLTPDQATELLRKDIADKASIIQKDITVPLTQFEFDALVTSVFNGGYGETLKNAVNSPVYKTVTIFKAFLARSKAGKPKKIMPGLVARRAAEAALFLFGIFNAFPESARQAWIATFMPIAEFGNYIPD